VGLIGRAAGPGSALAAALVIFGVAIGTHAPASAGAASAVPGSQQTTRDKLFTKEQAARGAELYAKHCDRCHDPAKVPPGKKPGPPTTGPKFIETWQDRTLGELFGSILNTMPSDGSITLTPEQTLDVVAHILQANGSPAGATALKNDDAMKAIVIVKGPPPGV
jgi:mono/diheme cytochrome c family protein